MDVKQCEFCRMLYQSPGKKLCGDCIIKLDDDFLKIREYLYDHDGAGIEEVSEATGVSRKAIFYLLKEERLIVGNEDGEANGVLTCESCKRPIHTGKLCAGCKNEVLTALHQSVSAVRKPPQRPKETSEESFKGVAKLSLKGQK